MANRIRGEIEAVLDGRPQVLCLTLGALAELEAALGEADLAGLVTRFESGRLSAHDLIRVIGAGLRGAGARIDDAAVGAIRIDGGAAGALALVAELLIATFTPLEAPEPPARPPMGTMATCVPQSSSPGSTG